MAWVGQAVMQALQVPQWPLVGWVGGSGWST